jgi:GTP pyrophosphokinase
LKYDILAGEKARRLYANAEASTHFSRALETAKKLYEWKLDGDTIIAGMLHDAVEDGGAKKEDISVNFGEEVSSLVDGVTKISDIKLRGSKDEEFVENLRKMFFAMAKDLQVVL